MANSKDERHYKALLDAYRVDHTPNTDQLVRAAVQRQMSDREFVQHLRRTPEHAQAYAGINNPDGSQKMNEAQYQANKDAYKQVANAAGVGMDESKGRWLAHHNVTPQEFSQKIAAYKQIQNNPEMFNAFKDILNKRQGARLTRKNLFEFVMGKAPKEWYDIWNEAATAYAAEQAGLHLGKNKGLLTVRKQLIEHLSKKGYTPEQLAAGMEKLATFMIEDRPLAHALNLGGGLSDRALAEAALGGKRSAKTLKKLELVQKTGDAFDTEQRASTGLYADETGQAHTLGAGQQKYGEQ